MNTLRADLTGLVDTIGGLPTHPLVVHLAVVMLPLSAIALLAIIAVPRWRQAYGWLTMAALLAGAGGAVLAAQTGEALAEQIGLPQDHATWGDLLEKVALVTLLAGAVWFWLQRRTAASTRGPRRVLGPPAQAVAALASIALAVATLGLTVVVGHSGATAVWTGRLPASAVTSTSRPSSTSSPTPTPTAPSAAASTTPPASSGAITMADVAAHASASDCWSVVDGGVYDLTSWIAQHPGGPAVITAMCGTDATTAFHDQHRNQSRPNDTLAGFEIGTLG